MTFKLTISTCEKPSPGVIVMGTASHFSSYIHKYEWTESKDRHFFPGSFLVCYPSRRHCFMAASVERLLEGLESRQKSMVLKGERSAPANSSLDQRLGVSKSSLQRNRKVVEPYPGRAHWKSGHQGTSIHLPSLPTPHSWSPLKYMALFYLVLLP